MTDNRKDDAERMAGATGPKERDSGLIKPIRTSLLSNLRSSFFAGIVVVAPIGITAAIVYWFLTGPMSRLDSFVKRALPGSGGDAERILQATPFLGVLISIIVIILIGAFAKNFFGRAFIKAGEDIFDNVPVVRNLYRFFKNVFETALQQSERSFKEVALVEYPRPGAWAMAFVVGETKGEVKHILASDDDELTSVFVPTVPNPTSGFLLFVPRKSLRTLSMSVEDAAKTVFSIGLVMPEFVDPDEAVRRLEAVAAGASEPSSKRSAFRLIGQGKSKPNRTE